MHYVLSIHSLLSSGTLIPCTTQLFSFNRLSLTGTVPLALYKPIHLKAHPMSIDIEASEAMVSFHVGGQITVGLPEACLWPQAAQ